MKLDDLYNELNRVSAETPDMPVCVLRNVDYISHLTISTFQISKHVPNRPEGPYLTTLGLQYPDTTVNCLKRAIEFHMNQYSGNEVFVENLVKQGGGILNPSEILTINSIHSDALRLFIEAGV